MSRRKVLLVVLVSVSGCMTNPAPGGWLRPARQAQADVHGAWIVVPTRAGADPLRGEFLGVAGDSVFVLGQDGNVRTRALADAGRVVVAWYDPQAQLLGFQTVLGTLSTISNGWFLVFTAPAWIITGTVATARASRAPLHHVEPGASWEPVLQFARFPAGPPSDLPRTLPVKPPLQAVRQ